MFVNKIYCLIGLIESNSIDVKKDIIATVPLSLLSQIAFTFTSLNTLLKVNSNSIHSNQLLANSFPEYRFSVFANLSVKFIHPLRSAV